MTPLSGTGADREITEGEWAALFAIVTAELCLRGEGVFGGPEGLKRAAWSLAEEYGHRPSVLFEAWMMIELGLERDPTESTSQKREQLIVAHGITSGARLMAMRLPVAPEDLLDDELGAFLWDGGLGDAA